MPLSRNAFRRLHYPVDIITQCVRWYLAYALSLRNPEEMMAERGIVVDHSTLRRWVIRLVPLPDKAFHRRGVPLVHGRNLHQSQRAVEIPVPRRRQHGADHRLFVDRQTGCPRRAAFLSQGYPSPRRT